MKLAIFQENNNISGYSNPELDMISKDIAELVRERQMMEQDIAQKEADIKIKNGEIKSLQSELDTLAATLKQLENQRGEAQKRLNDLKAQVKYFNSSNLHISCSAWLLQNSKNIGYIIKKKSLDIVVLYFHYFKQFSCDSFSFLNMILLF